MTHEYKMNVVWEKPDPDTVALKTLPPCSVFIALGFGQDPVRLGLHMVLHQQQPTSSVDYPWTNILFVLAVNLHTGNITEWDADTYVEPVKTQLTVLKRSS